MSKIIGIDARFYAEAGPGRYIKNILEQLESLDKKNTYLVFLRPRGMFEYVPSNPNFKKIPADYSWYSWEEQIFFLFKLISNKVELLYVPHFNIPVLFPGKLVTAIPDLIMHTFSTEKGTTLPKFYYRFKKLMYKLVVWWAVKRSFKVIVPTKDTLNDFVDTFPTFDCSKYILAPEGVDPAFRDRKVNSKKVLNNLGIETPFLLYVGSSYEHKNLVSLINAFKILVEEYKYTGKLVIVGKKDKYSLDLKKLVDEMEYEDKIIMPGLINYVTDDEVLSLRKEADLFVFPSLKEGFSLTPMESQEVGLACVISDIPCHREVYGDSVYYFDPKDTKDISKKINVVLNDEKIKNELIQKGYLQIKKYDWKDTAIKTLEVFNQALQ